jgi:hypothetical protein
MKKIVLLLGMLALMVLGSYTEKTNGAEISIIIHKDNPVTTLSASEVKLYWLRKIKKRWPVINKNIRPADRKAKCEEQTAFYAKVLTMSAADVETYFTERQYAAAEKPQDKFATDADIINFVAEEGGAIGFVNSASLTAAQKARVKVVCVVQ